MTDTVFWFVTAGLVLFGRFDSVARNRHFVRRAALATLELSALISVLSEVFVLNLPAELVLVPVFALLAGMSVLAAGRPELRPVKSLVDGVSLLASVFLLLYVTVSLVNNWASLEKVDLVSQFALPVWLTVGTLPYIYALGLFAAYEQAFVRINKTSEAGWWSRTRARLVLLSSFHIRAREVGAFTGPWQFRLAAANSFRAGRQVVAGFREAQREAMRAAAEKESLLRRYAGVHGVDADGRQLDRREFEVTTETLRWIATCQMGWYNSSGRYRPDLLEFVLDGFMQGRLPQPHGVGMRVSDDGQKWFAWRQTIGGWVFGIGAAGPPPNQWEYDGREAPSGFPSDDPVWGDGPFGTDVNVNW
jgi:hypothetical protein